MAGVDSTALTDFAAFIRRHASVLAVQPQQLLQLALNEPDGATVRAAARTERHTRPDKSTEAVCRPVRDTVGDTAVAITGHRSGPSGTDAEAFRSPLGCPARDIAGDIKGDVGVVPMQFLREFVTQMDLVDEHDDYDPATPYGFYPSALNSEEEHVLGETALVLSDEDDALVPKEDVW